MKKIKPKRHWFDNHIEKAVRNSEADRNAPRAQTENGPVTLRSAGYNVKQAPISCHSIKPLDLDMLNHIN